MLRTITSRDINRALWEAHGWQRNCSVALMEHILRTEIGEFLTLSDVGPIIHFQQLTGRLGNREQDTRSDGAAELENI